MLEYHIIARNKEEAVQVAVRTAQVNRERYGRVQNVYPEPRIGPDRWVVILESGQSEGNPNERNLRNNLIAEIQRNRMNAGKLGHKGVRPVSASDLVILHNMSTQDLEQTAKLTRQLTIPVVGQSRGNLGWQPLVEGVSKLTAVDYSAYYKEQGYEVKVVPNKRNPDRLDMYIRKIEQSRGNPKLVIPPIVPTPKVYPGEPLPPVIFRAQGNPQQTIWYAGTQLTWDGKTWYDKDLNYLQQMIDATRARGKKAAVTHHGNIHYFYYER